jgi:hypothetical protein
MDYEAVIKFIKKILKTLDENQTYIIEHDKIDDIYKSEIKFFVCSK